MSHTNKGVDEQVIARSVVDFPSQGEAGQGVPSIILRLASFADSIEPWGKNVRLRDEQLLNFFLTESFLKSAIYSAAIRNAAFEWEIVGADPTKPKPSNTIAAVTHMLRNFDRGRGWELGIIKTFVDLYTQDNGAFWEIIRADDKPESPVLNVAPLDAGRCRRTGNPFVPVIYVDRHGREHALKWYQVVTLEEFPSSIEKLYGIQICAVSRVLEAAQVMRAISTYKYEKLSGQNTKAISFVSGVSRFELEEALALASEEGRSKGFLRYSPPVIVAGLDPTNPVSVSTIDLAGLPDGYNEEVTFKWYLTLLSLALGVDYQELGPLPGGELGSSLQAQILHLKTRGKGPAMVMALLEHIINYSGIIPANVRFVFREADVSAAVSSAEARFLRGKDRALRLNAGELDSDAARELAFLDGDLPEYILESYKLRAGLSEAMISRTGDGPVTSAGVGGGAERNGDARPNNARIDSAPESVIGGVHMHDEHKAKGGDCGIAGKKKGGIRVSPSNTVEITWRDIARQRRILARRLLRDNRGDGRKPRGRGRRKKA